MNLPAILKPLVLPARYDELSPTAKRLVREEYARLQGGRCWYCSEMLSGPPSAEVQSKSVDGVVWPQGFFDWPVHLHHDKVTGLTIGAVHCRCNAVSFKYEELPNMEP